MRRGDFLRHDSRVSDRPIADYALLSDRRTAALVSGDGSVDWLCLPRFDGPSVFGRILDPGAGHFSIRPAQLVELTRRYRGGTMVLETSFRTGSGRGTLTDAMAMTGRRALLRRIERTEGSVEVELEYAPRPDYGAARPALFGATGSVLGGGVGLASSAPLTVEGETATARFTLRAGESASFALDLTGEGQWPVARIGEWIDEAAAAWDQGGGTSREDVQRSVLVLRALTHEPTGAVVAAPTTSLPVRVGDDKNWDYRYGWIRDSSFALEALARVGHEDEAFEILRWMLRTVSEGIQEGGDLQVVHRVDGNPDLEERELPHLAGWRGSSPVRVGNAAAGQRQLDVYGELLASAHRVADRLGELEPEGRRVLVEAAEAAAARWPDPDQGLWEARGEPRHFLHSKLMCWVALDRAVAIAPLLDAEERTTGWIGAREEIRAAILEQSWSERAGAFTDAFGSDRLDASALLLGIYGFLPPDDQRLRLTRDAIATRLTDARGLVRRHEEDHGGWPLCTFWLAEALAMAGEAERARETFERVVKHCNDVGLLSERVDPDTGELLGNFPLALSHAALVSAAAAIQRVGN